MKTAKRKLSLDCVLVGLDYLEENNLAHAGLTVKDYARVYPRYVPEEIQKALRMRLPYQKVDINQSFSTNWTTKNVQRSVYLFDSTTMRRLFFWLGLNAERHLRPVMADGQPAKYRRRVFNLCWEVRVNDQGSIGDFDPRPLSIKEAIVALRSAEASYEMARTTGGFAMVPPWANKRFFLRVAPSIVEQDP